MTLKIQPRRKLINKKRIKKDIAKQAAVASKSKAQFDLKKLSRARKSIQTRLK